MLDNINNILEKNEIEKLRLMINIKEYHNEKIILNLGSGDTTNPNYINIDLYDDSADIRLDIINIPIEEYSVDGIISSHVIDHFDLKQGKEMIKEWSRILKVGGKLRVECSDLLGICKLFINSNENTKMKLYSCLFGFPWTPGFGHKFGYTKEHMIKILKCYGFYNFKDVDLIKVDDYSKEKINKFDLKYDDSYDWFDDETFKKLNISLEATKGDNYV